MARTAHETGRARNRASGLLPAVPTTATTCEKGGGRIVNTISSAMCSFHGLHHPAYHSHSHTLWLPDHRTQASLTHPNPHAGRREARHGERADHAWRSLKQTTGRAAGLARAVRTDKKDEKACACGTASRARERISTLPRCIGGEGGGPGVCWCAQPAHLHEVLLLRGNICGAFPPVRQAGARHLAPPGERCTFFFLFCSCVAGRTHDPWRSATAGWALRNVGICVVGGRRQRPA